MVALRSKWLLHISVNTDGVANSYLFVCAATSAATSPAVIIGNNF